MRLTTTVTTDFLCLSLAAIGYTAIIPREETNLTFTTTTARWFSAFFRQAGCQGRPIDGDGDSHGRACVNLEAASFGFSGGCDTQAQVKWSMKAYSTPDCNTAYTVFDGGESCADYPFRSYEVFNEGC
jgi:hypothetical protein